MSKLIGYSITAFLCAIIFAVILGPPFLYFNWGALDRGGWIPRWHRVNIYIKGDWFDGERRVCSGIQARLDDKIPMEISALHCPPDPNQPYRGAPRPSANVSTHNLSVVFWGRISRPRVRPADEEIGTKFEWNCTRRSDAPFGDQCVCRAIN
jgi:hypothetical protein